jgi:peptidase E
MGSYDCGSADHSRHLDGLNRARDPWVFAYAAALAHPAGRPKLCVLTTAGGDQAERVARFERAFADDEFELSVLTLFDRPAVKNTVRHLLGQDVVWVDRGSLVNLLAVWRAHGIDRVLRECGEAGVVLGGESAGSLCWFTAATTDSLGPLRPLQDGLALLPVAGAVHYEDRREQFHQLLADGEGRHRLRHRRRRGPALRGHRAGRGDQRPPRRRGQPGPARGGRARSWRPRS